MSLAKNPPSLRSRFSLSSKFAKELLAGFVGAEVDKLVETKGLDYVDAERVRLSFSLFCHHSTN